MKIRLRRESFFSHDLWVASYVEGEDYIMLGVWDEETIDAIFEDMGWRETIDNISNKGPESIDFIVDFKTGEFNFL